jgi:hypothetical protein
MINHLQVGLPYKPLKARYPTLGTIFLTGALKGDRVEIVDTE